RAPELLVEAHARRAGLEPRLQDADGARLDRTADALEREGGEIGLGARDPPLRVEAVGVGELDVDPAHAATAGRDSRSAASAVSKSPAPTVGDAETSVRTSAATAACWQSAVKSAPEKPRVAPASS